MKAFLSTLMVSAFLSAIALAGQDIAVSDLPKPVTDAIEAGFSGAKLIKAEKEMKNGVVIYEVKIEKKDMTRQEVKLKADGEVVGVDLDD